MSAAGMQIRTATPVKAVVRAAPLPPECRGERPRTIAGLRFAPGPACEAKLEPNRRGTVRRIIGG